MRGFQFRGASPQINTVEVGGIFQKVNSLEYMFPLTADDMLRGVTFVDFGTVEYTQHINWRDFRVAPGFGLRVTIPMISAAPIALDFAFPVQYAPTDMQQIFSFFVGRRPLTAAARWQPTRSHGACKNAAARVGCGGAFGFSKSQRPRAYQ